MTIAAWEKEDLRAGLCGMRWDDTVEDMRSRMKLERSSAVSYERVANDLKLDPGIQISVEARFQDGDGQLEELMLSGSPTFPDNAGFETWESVVGPAVNAWLKKLGFSHERSQRWQSDEEDGGNLASLGEGDYDYFRSPTGAKAEVTVLWDPPQWIANIRGPSGPDFEIEED